MKPVLAWLKKYGMLAGCFVVAVVALVVGPIVASGMSANTVKTVQSVVSTDQSALGRTNVDYELPRLDSPSESLISESLPVHRDLTDHFVSLRAALASQSTEVWEAALERNRAGHEVLIEGLFPEPSEQDRQLLPGEFAKAYINTYHSELLKSINAGSPPDADRVLLSVQAYAQSQTAQISDQEARAELSPEEAEKLENELRGIRLGMVRQGAADIDLYGEASAFTQVPGFVPQELPDVEQAWDWQQQAWIHADVVRAIGLANQHRGEGRGVPGSVVKRLIAVAVDEFDYGYEPVVNDDPFGRGGGGAAPVAGDVVVPVFDASVTGRTSGPSSGNAYYDVRYVTLDVLVSSRRLPVLFDAISATNFMTVLECDLERIDSFRDLAFGHYYGDEAVVRAQLRIETIWLREWTSALIPPRIRTGLGIVDPEGSDDEFDPGN